MYKNSQLNSLKYWQNLNESLSEKKLVALFNKDNKFCNGKQNSLAERDG
jgi:hypothetical protein